MKKNIFTDAMGAYDAPVAANDDRVLELVDASTLIDASALPPRDWIIPSMCLRGYMAMLVAPGATGKSMFALTAAVSVAVGRDLLGLGSLKHGRVLVVNNEDDDDEMHRRVAAICAYYCVTENELIGRLFFYSGYSEKLMVSHEIEGTVVPAYRDIDALKEAIAQRDIDMMVIDPLVSIHQSNENDNVKMDAMVSQLKRIAGEANIALWAIHHTRKMNGQRFDGDAEVGRGASAIKDAARIVYTLDRIDEDTQKKHSLPASDAVHIIGLRDAKTNFSAKTSGRKWYQLQSIAIGNGETVGVPVKYQLPEIHEPKVQSPESKKVEVTQRFARLVYEWGSSDEGKVKATELAGEYKLRTGVGKTTYNEHVRFVPEGYGASHMVKFDDKMYRVFRTQDDKPTAPHYIHLERQQ